MVKSGVFSLLISSTLFGCSSPSTTPAANNDGVGAEAGSATGGDSGDRGDRGDGGSTSADGGVAAETTDGAGARTDGESPNGDGGVVETTGDAAPDPAPFDADIPDALPGDYQGTPFGGTPQTIPGTIELARYDVGGEGVAFHDTAAAPAPFNKCGFTRSDAVNLACTGSADLAFPACTTELAGEVYLAYLGNGEWFNYTVNVEEAGTYVISGHVATASATTQVSFAFSPTIGTGAVTLPSDVGCSGHEAYHNWSTANNLGQIALTPGTYVMTLKIVNQGLNLDWFAFTKQ